MRISKRCEYGIKAIMELSRSRKPGTQSLRELSAAANVPFKFLEQIMMDLKRIGWVASERGKEGGYKLLEDPRRIGLGAIVELLDGKSASRKNENYQARPVDRFCGFYASMAEMQTVYFKKLNGISIWDLCERSDEMLAKASNNTMYHI